MVRFLRNWLVWILAGMMMTGAALVLIPLSKNEEARAKNELSLLMDRAFDTINDGKAYAEPVIAAEEENMISKARAIARFLEHDDTLLETDALSALGSQLSVDRIDVANLQGELIASSDASRIGLALGSDEAFSWTMVAADDPSAALTHTDSSDRSLLYACVGRTEIDGFVLLTRDDPFVDDALEKSGTDALLAELCYNGDLIFESTVAGTDGAFYDANSLCVRKTQNGVTLIAARATGDVYRMRNAALAAFGTMALCIVICGVASYLLRLEPVVVLDEPEASGKNGTEPEERAMEEVPTECEPEQPEREKKREIAGQQKRAKKRAPMQGRRSEPTPPAEGGEDTFEQILDGPSPKNESKKSVKKKSATKSELKK